MKKLEPFKTIKLKNHELHFSISNALALERVNSFWTKEPETLLWIDTFTPNATYYDVGANIGLYALYAATKGCNVYAFEPESQNYAMLNKNIYASKLSDTITALPLAISDENSIDKLHVRHFIEATSGHNFKQKLNYNREAFEPSFTQGCISMSLDTLTQKLPFPDYIKIDVDGIEDLILNGSQKTLSDERLKSILIEFNSKIPEHIDAYHALSKEFECSNALQQKVQNYIFYRGESPFNKRLRMGMQ